MTSSVSAPTSGGAKPDPSAEQRLRGRELQLAYGDRVVVDGLDIDVPDGTITAVIGPNGCGKSTVL